MRNKDNAGKRGFVESRQHCDSWVDIKDVRDSSHSCLFLNHRLAKYILFLTSWIQGQSRNLIETN